jgi:hypothetical protein
MEDWERKEREAPK